MDGHARHGEPCRSSAAPSRHAAPSAVVPAANARRLLPACDARTFFLVYFALVFVGRLLLRSSCAKTWHWAVTMMLEDGLSLASFVVGLLYLHHSDGALLSVFAKRMAASPEGAAAAVAAFGASSERTSGTEASQGPAQPAPLAPRDRVARQSIRLFYFAL
uniref:Uncharacterized protein n=1 Tax=Alexandrium andersonii TaxID=327968 RepID=A0A7S2B4T3_9DINO|mmetsp:Transcript_2199/g.4912  ORF Transcript_2199/g.4912 Transcript_2199/m.4912 type:complete len:161 (+) Transcript_2199:156-638(+)